jgi:hypothetical protein
VVLVEEVVVEDLVVVETNDVELALMVHLGKLVEEVVGIKD